MEQRLSEVKLLLGKVHNATFATVNEDSSPHNTPMFYVLGDRMDYIYWSSSPHAIHSKNLKRLPKVFVVVYEATAGAGLYIEADNVTELTEEELAVGLNAFNKVRVTNGKQPKLSHQFLHDSPQRLYRATICKLYVNISTRDSNNNFVSDSRVQIQASDLK